MSKIKVLIFYTAIGQGHKSMAENIAFYFGQEGAEVRLENILDVEKGWFTLFFEKLYAYILEKAPWIWNFLYQTSFMNLFLGLRLPVAAMKRPTKAFRSISQFNPDIIISTHAVASATVALLKKKRKYNKLFAIAFSDYHLHRYWLYDEADFYLANIAEQKQQMISLGIPSEKIFVCGMTLKPQEQFNQNETKDELRIDRKAKVVLMGSGSMGTGISAEALVFLAKGILNELSQMNLKGHIVFVCGKNKKLYDTLNSFRLENISILSFYSQMEKLYTIADLFITKPGGLSIAEALRYKLPILVNYWLPGQEEFNIRYLTKQNLVMIVPGSATIRTAVEELVGGKFRKKLAENVNLGQIIDLEKPGERIKIAIKQIIHT